MRSIDSMYQKELRLLRQLLGEVMARDQPRLRAGLDRAEAKLRASLVAGVDVDAADLDSLRRGFEVSVARRSARAASIPAIALDESLPVSREAERIVALIRAHRVVVIAGETGSGKTTQLPKLCLAAGRGIAGMIGCTQPRRIAARSVARRVAQELHTEVGGLVGFQVRFTDQVGEHALIKFMTDGILLAETQNDRLLSAYDTLIIDEAHERSLNIDFLLGYLKRLLDKRRDLKIIVTSATIDTERFSKHFSDAPVVSVEGRSFPVEVRYRPANDDSVRATGRPSSGLSEAGSRSGQRSDPLADAVEEISREDPLGDILVFLPGEREIRDAHDALSRRKYRETEVLPLYARLSARDQDRIFNPGPKRRIVLTTNVAETSLTVPRIRYVIDSGEARINRYSHRHKVQRLHIEPISQASADQRKGRCGRVGPGICYRLYDEADFLQRARYTDPEILRSSLSGVILRMMNLGLGAIEQFPFLEAPSERATNDGYAQLIELAAITEDKRLPIDVKLARMLLESEKLGALREMITIASFLSVQDPRERPPEARAAADAAHAEFVEPKSDFVGVLKLWAAYNLAHEELTQSKLRDWCEKRFLNFLRMREWRELHRQLLLQTDELGWKLVSGVASFEALHRALISGLPGNLGRKDEKGVYHGPRGRRFNIFPGSALAKSPPLWVLSATLLDTQKLYGITNARIEPQWAIEQAAHLIRRAHHDPHWDRKRGQVMALEQITLFGLTLVERRPVHYGSIDPQEARRIFIAEALVPCEIDAQARCIAHNRSVLMAARAEEAKQRRHGLLRDEGELAAWWEARLPEGICTATALDSYCKRASPAQTKALEWQLDDVLQKGSSEADRFPQYFVQGRERFRLSYVFDPGKPDDGVTLHLPLAWLNAVSPARIGWLVPGLLESKVAELIRGLPKSLRRNFVPAPDFARAFVEAETASEAELPQALGAYLRRVTGIEVPAGEWQTAQSALSEHLCMRIRLLDEHKQILAEGRDLVALRAQYAERARTAFAEKAAGELAQEDLRVFPVRPIPESVTAASGMRAYPALVDRVHRVDLAVFEQESEARITHAAGVRRLLCFALAEKLKQVRKQLPLGAKLALAYTSLASPEQLRDDIAQGALDDLLARDGATARSAESFRLSEAAISKNLSLLAVERLNVVEAALAVYAELTPKLKSSLMGFAKANLDDLREQLTRLIFPGFARQFAIERLRELPRYLKAMRLRAERLENDPRKDQARMLVVRDFELQLAAIKTPHPEVDTIRWSIEELRVQLFAQDLGTREAVSEKRIQRAIELVQRG
jgi:ATP-dependent helicase HrpA